MSALTVDLLQPGMTVLEDVINSRGHVLIPANSELSEKHLAGLKLWRVISVCVEESAVQNDETELEHFNSEEENIELIKNHISRVFALNQANLDCPVFENLIPLCEKSLLKRGFSPQTKNPAGKNKNRVAGITEPLSALGLVRANKDVASPPIIYLKLIEEMNKPTSSSTDIGKIISNDPGLTGRLLRLVNSAYYSFPAPIETVSRATTLVGTDELANISLVTSVIKSFSSSLEDVVDMKRFWEHSIACALFSRGISRLRNDQYGERLFVAGILHDVGRLLMYMQVPEMMAEMIENSVAGGRTLVEEEKKILGFTHAKVGAKLAKAWKLSPRQREAIRFHHSPMAASRFKTEAAIVHVADFLSCAFAIGHSGNSLVPKLDLDAWDHLQLNPAHLSVLSAEVESGAASLARIFCEKQ